MSQPWVCTGCRIKLALRTRAAKTLDRTQKRQFSGALAIGQEYRQERPSQPYYDRNDGQRYARNNRCGNGEVRGSRRPQSAPQGRYSGALRPEQLLQQLDEPRVEIRKHYLEDAGIAQQRQLMKEFNPLVTAIDQSSYLEAWQILRDLSNSPDHLKRRTRTLPRKKASFEKVVKKLEMLMRRLETAWVRSLRPPSSEEAAEDRIAPGRKMENLYLGKKESEGVKVRNTGSTPSPWEVMQAVKDLGWLTPSMRVEMLWRLSKSVMAERIREDFVLPPEGASQLSQQLVLLWHDTLRSHLRPHDPTTPGNVSSLDWSFLPPADAIVNVQRGSESTLEDVLAMIVPLSGPNDPKNTHNIKADYPSALMVSLDVLRGSTPSSSDAKLPLKSECRPLISYFDGILTRVAHPSIPPAVMQLLERGEDPTLAYYEGLVRRLSLKDVPPKRTERGRIEDRSKTVRADELGRPVGTANLKNVNESVAEDFNETGELANDDAEEEGPPPLSKEGLRAAGFTVQQNWDMEADVHAKVDTWIKRLGRANQNTNLDITQSCWTEVCEFNAAEIGASSLPLYLYEHFMISFLCLRQPKMAVEVWNAVIQAGYEPTVRTWTVMMRGCALAKDSDTMEAFWRRMHDQGIQPDQYSWSVRITCLINSRRIKEGLAAVYQMGEEWMAAVRKQHAPATPKISGKKHADATTLSIDYAQYTTDINGVPRPNIVVMNSAISILAGKSDSEIPRVLAWGRSFNIRPDLTTYNTLINVSMRHNQTTEAIALLSRMQNQNISPDSTTFTVLLTALFASDYFSTLPPASQTPRLLSLISSIEASSPSARLNAKGYALAIDRMLKDHANPAAARALLEHMSARGVEPTTHIYTILMTSYFSSQPPDIAAAEALWTRIQRSNSGYGAPLDVVFYDRMVENYARLHADVGMGPMLRFLERMNKEGKRPGWRALELVARAFAERGEWARLEKLVGDLREGGGLLRLGARGVMGQNEFWRFVIGTGVLGAEGELGEQGLRRRVGSGSFHGIGVE